MNYIRILTVLMQSKYSHILQSNLINLFFSCYYFILFIFGLHSSICSYFVIILNYEYFLSKIILSFQSFFSHFHLRGFSLRSIILHFLLCILSDHFFLIFPTSRSFYPNFSYVFFLSDHSFLIISTYSFFLNILSSFFLRIRSSHLFFPHFSYLFFLYQHTSFICATYTFILIIPSSLFLGSLSSGSFLPHFPYVFFYPDHCFLTFATYLFSIILSSFSYIFFLPDHSSIFPH